jgi:MinD superfamily P-loop ATPase
MDAETLEIIHQRPIETPLISITGGKGGVGKSTVAVNIAEALVQSGYRVALADADVDGPDDHILLNIPLRNPLDVTSTLPLIIDAKCTRCRQCVDACRRHALFQTKDSYPILMGDCNGCEACILVCPSDAIKRGEKTVGKIYKSGTGNLTLFTGELIPGVEESSFIVNALKERVFNDAKDSDIIIIDTSPGAHCNVINALKGSNEAFAVTDPTPLGVHDLDLILKLLRILHIKANIILNRSDLPGVREQVESVSRAYDANISVEIPVDGLLLKSYVEGVPVVRMYPEAASSKKLITLSEEIAEKYLK